MATYKTSWVRRLVDNVWTKTFAFAHAKTVYTDYENGKTLDKSLEEIQKRISDNGYSDMSGGKNLLNPSLCKFENVTYSDGVYTQVKADTNQNIIANIRPFSGNKPLSTLLWETLNSPYISEVEFTKNSTFDSLMIGFNGSILDTVVNYDCSHLTNGKKYKCIVNFNNIQQGTLSFIPMITEDLSLDYTDYEPYFPSNKMITEENTQQSTEMMDIKMLGWSVPRECPIQNEVTGNQFMQKVGRVDLGTLNYAVTSSGLFQSEGLKGIAKPASNGNVAVEAYLNGYKCVASIPITGTDTENEFAISTETRLYINDISQTDATAFKSAMQGQYLYYELATPITTTIDGNEIGETVGDVRKETTVNLLNANQPSNVTSGVTKTNNGDGTYTIHGIATQIVYTNIGRVDNFETGVYKLTGTKVTSGNVFLYVNGVKKDGSSDYSILTENTKPISLIDKSAYTYLIVGVAVANGVTVDETIKPMLTTNLSATYDDFVPYTGDDGSLNGDVADLRGDVDGMLTSVKVSKVYYNLAGNSFDSETAGKTMIAKVNFANFKNKSMIVSGDFIISSLPFTTTKKGDYLEVRLSKSDYPELASKIDSGIKKLAFGISGEFSSKVVGCVNCGLQDDYIRIWLTFNDAYNFNTADLQSGIADFFF